MDHLAYACEIKEEHFDAIKSEKPDFDLEETKAWLLKNKRGWFIRDEGTLRDCSYLTTVELGKIYVFNDFDLSRMFRPLMRI